MNLWLHSDTCLAALQAMSEADAYPGGLQPGTTDADLADAAEMLSSLQAVAGRPGAGQLPGSSLPGAAGQQSAQPPGLGVFGGVPNPFGPQVRIRKQEPLAWLHGDRLSGLMSLA